MLTDAAAAAILASVALSLVFANPLTSAVGVTGVLAILAWHARPERSGAR